MNTNQLMVCLDTKIENAVSESEEIFLKLLKEVWKIDHSVSPVDVFENVSGFKRSYFQAVLKGRENATQTDHLLSDWISLGASADFLIERRRYGKLIWELNALRSDLWRTTYVPGAHFQI